MKTKRILILANNDVGLYKFRKELLQELIQKKYEVYISLPQGEQVKKMEEMGCHFIQTAIDRRGINPIKDFKLFCQYMHILKEVHPDIVLTYTIKPNIYGGIACRCKKIFYISNITGLGSALEQEGILQKLLIFLYRIALKKVGCCFTQNRENEQFLEDKKIAKGKLRLISGSGVNLEEYSPMEYPSEENGLSFLFISRIMKEKGIEQYIELAKEAKKRNWKANFHILGFCEQEYEMQLKELQNDSIVVYHGLQEDVKKFIQVSHCTIHPSYYPEGMSNVLLESAASARPIITTKRSGCKEVIEDGETGYLIEPNNSKDLIEKVENFKNLTFDQRKEMGLLARKKVENEFDRNIIINAYLEEIEKG